jgi:hypothetical protein
MDKLLNSERIGLSEYNTSKNASTDSLDDSSKSSSLNSKNGTDLVIFIFANFYELFMTS